ncbi:hypothetical protein F3N42_11660 [Marinihelvus fidelis]|uniref:Uncharacterized protein n=1 Tax=Marinihelvus fidelis TaxID=2613842 RepID=A0A5N0T8F3_9GAMM|nr:DUF6502 family protein [Marinihelvus fidelis]KAA9130998.1 hypothetical protein F3N42_11660 [Marinihelvus fidelis]
MSLQKTLKPQDVAALSSGVESLLRRLIRVLVGHMSLTKLEELVRLVFVEESERQLRREFPNKAPPMSQLALLTGLDSRPLGKIRSHPAYGQERGPEASFMRNFTSTTRLLDKWSTDPGYLDESTGRPLPITIQGQAPSIESLMKSAGFIRGVTARSVAERLELGGAATWDRKTGVLTLVTEKFLPSTNADLAGAVEVGFNAIGHLVDTVLTNLERLDEGQPRDYQRAYWSNRIAPHQVEAFQARITQMMTEFEDQGLALLGEYEMDIESPSQVTAGFGLYYFEDAPDGESSNR